jgi:hypothetical protein
MPKLFYLAPEDENVRKRTMGEGIKLHKWADFEKKYKEETAKRRDEWKEA